MIIARGRPRHDARAGDPIARMAAAMVGLLLAVAVIALHLAN